MKNYTRIIIISVFITTALSCSDENIDNLGTKNTNIPSRVIYNGIVNSTDSTRILFRLKAPIIQEYSFIDSPYVITPKGVEITFFEKGKTEPSILTADYAKMIQKKKWYEAKGNVVLINSDRDTLKTNQLFWDELDKKIFSNDTVRILRADGITTNTSIQGIEATSDFKNYKLRKNHGSLPMKEIEESSN